MTGRLLVVGNPARSHVGGHLLAAAATLGVPAGVADASAAYGSGFVQRVLWRVADRRPANIATFERGLLARVTADRPAWVLCTGLAPVRRPALDRLRELGATRLNFLTDDPWNPAHRSRWFLDALSGYDVVFTPRRSNAADLAAAGCPDVRYLPFAYNPAEHFPADPDPAVARPCDVLFVGGADPDRVELLSPLVHAGLEVALYGGYWDRHPEFRAAARGHADPATLRAATAAARVVLVLVRRANRDGHVMRTFEAAAGRACLLVEDTAEHRDIFGPDGECVTYFDNSDTMVARARALLADEPTRSRLAEAAYRRVVDGKNTYADRLRTMLEARTG